jgi:acetate kinase
VLQLTLHESQDALSENEPNILVLNSGSSSIKFALFGGEPTAGRRLRSGTISGIGASSAQWKLSIVENEPTAETLGRLDHPAAIEYLLDHLAALRFTAVGHRIVHGGPNHQEPTRIDQSLIDDLKSIVLFAPEHLPQAIALIEAIAKRFPDLPQVACFDTTFHKDLPTVARTLPLPRRLQSIGVRRYGFHGLSFEYLMGELERVGRAGETDGRIILAHLGNGASLAAVHHRKPMDTTMGMTPAGGLVMATRTGDLDPGVVSFLERQEKLSAEQFHRMVNHESGMVGISETSGDMRELMQAAKTDPRADEAIELFCYSARKWIGAFAAALGGLDTLVFSGGIGEHAPEVRAQICRGLSFFGIELDPARNSSNEPIITRDGATTTVRVIPTDEESTILRSVQRILRPSTSFG